MSLKPGTKLGSYEILSPLGKGGMGEVFRARDSKLDRDVAIKVLPEFYARDPERVARFQREAKVLASLNHPHIAAIYGFEESDEKRFLVMELVEGDTLGERIKAGRMPIEDALSFAQQIAEALEAAHESGIIHRDLKPANVKVTPDGTVKVLDFGLAKVLMTGGDASQTEMANSPTITAQHSPTAAGVILGTAAYMSPEQARGKPLDKRTDIWSFGCVLYECLGGRRPFEGETTTDLVAKILERDPDWNQLPSDTPATVSQLLRRCLTKDRNRRLQAIADARVELEDAIRDPFSSSVSMIGVAPAEGGAKKVWPGSNRLAHVCVGMFMGAAILYLGIFALQPFGEQTIQAPVRFAFSLTEANGGKEEKQLSPVDVRITPDGSAIVIEVAGTGRPLYIRELDRITTRPLPGTEGGTSPFFSPDGRSIGFVLDRRLLHVPRSEGAPSVIGTASGFVGSNPLWVNDDLIVFTSLDSQKLLTIGPTETAPTALLSASDVPDVVGFETYCRTPNPNVILVGGYTGNSIDHNAIISVSLTDGSTTPIVSNAAKPMVVGDEFLVFLRGSSLVAMTFDFRSMRATGNEVVVHDGVTTSDFCGGGVFDVSSSGTLAYVGGQRMSDGRHLAWVDRGGVVGRVFDKADAYNGALALSPDGKHVTVNTLRRALELWTVELSSQAMRRLKQPRMKTSVRTTPSVMQAEYEASEPFSAPSSSDS